MGRKIQLLEYSPIRKKYNKNDFLPNDKFYKKESEQRGGFCNTNITERIIFIINAQLHPQRGRKKNFLFQQNLPIYEINNTMAWLIHRYHTPNKHKKVFSL